MKVYGIVRCDTVKRARAWLDAQGIAYDFVDFRKSPPTRDLLEHWAKAVGVESLVNRRGSTWRMLSSAEQSAAADAESAIALMLARPTVIKRPVVESAHALVVGFDAADYARRFGAVRR